MHPADIKALIEKAGQSQASIARSVRATKGDHVSQAAVHHVIRGLSKSRRIAQQIARVTGVPVSQLWPGKYPGLEKLERVSAPKHRKAA